MACFSLNNTHWKVQKTMLDVCFSVKPLNKKLLEIQEDTNLFGTRTEASIADLELWGDRILEAKTLTDIFD
jgi:hypothetical protein